jgi:hypothetical protein
MDIHNEYKVPKKMWKKWTETERYRFNYMYDFVLNNQSILKHPNADLVPTEFWSTVAWNIAWISNDV